MLPEIKKEGQFKGLTALKSKEARQAVHSKYEAPSEPHKELELLKKQMEDLLSKHHYFIYLSFTA